MPADAKELVTLMRRKVMTYDHSPTNEQHMLKLAKRAHDQHGLTLSTESPEAFVASMLEAGLLTDGILGER